MAHGERYGDRDSWRGEHRGRDRDEWQRGRERGDSGYGRDPHDRNPGAHVDYYRGGDRGQRRMGPEGGFEARGDYRRTDSYADQGQSWGRGDRRDARGEDREDRGMGPGLYGATGGSFAGRDDPFRSGGGLGVAPEFSHGPRFDRADVGSVGTHGVHPVSSAFGDARDPLGPPMGGGSTARARAILDQHERRHDDREERGWGGRSEFDPHYSEWRRRQVEQLDRDYDEYRRENASRFESEFGSWRERRGQQRSSMRRVTEHMEVVGSDGQHVGTVDKVANDRIILTKSDPAADGHHHSIPCSWLDSVEDRVTLNRTAEEAMQAWRDEETSRALFERPDSGSDGPHILERSFSGTYRDE